MKKNFLFAAFTIVAMCFTQDVLAQNKEANKNQVPKEVKKYLKKHFSGIEIQQAENKESEYIVYLADGTDLEFNNKFEIVEIANEKGVPTEILPLELNNFLVANYPDNKVIQWTLKDSGKQRVSLDDYASLVFDPFGNFLSIGR